MPLGNGNDGEEIAYNPDSGPILHLSGIGGNRILENIDSVTLAISPLTITGSYQFEVAGLTHAGGGDFFATSIFPSEGLFLVSSSGASTRIGKMDHAATGLAIHEGVLYTTSRDRVLRSINPATGAALSGIRITIDGVSIRRATALATNPDTGQLFAVTSIPHGSR